MIVEILAGTPRGGHNDRMTEPVGAGEPTSGPTSGPTSTPEPGPGGAAARPRGAGPVLAWWVGLVAHLVMGVWYAASGLIAPPWAVAALLVIWVLLLIVGLRLRARRPWWMLAVPVLAVAIWVAVVSAGETFLGWTA
jgi:hypothetical protein